jgi:carboxyl-terminal processing protease
MAEPHRIESAPKRHNNKNRAVPTVVMVFAFLLVGGLGYFAGSVNSGHFFWGGSLSQLVGGSQLDLSSVQQTYQAVKANFDGDIDQTKLIEGANKGLVDALGDQYTVFMNAKESTQFDDSLSGNIGGGIGVEVGLRNEVPTVVRVLKDNPAEKAGLAVGDIITKVNGETTEKVALNDVVTKIRGDVGTTVKLTVIRDGVEKDISVTRAQVNNPSAYGEIRGETGIMTVSRFDDQTGSLARAVAQDFKSKGVKHVVLDLRGNGGGFVTAAQAVAGIWLDNQLVVTEKRGNTVTDELKSTGTPILSGIPTVVLVNESSASASEIVAGALRDQKAATLMGVTTFGKGSVQKLMSLMNDATLKVTVARWYTPSNVNISKKGLSPDTEVKRTVDDINAGRDPQLDAALASF